MPLAEARDYLAKQMNFAHAHAMEPGHGGRTGAIGVQRRRRDSYVHSKEFRPHPAAILSRREGFVKQPGRQNNQGEQVNGIKKIRHGASIPFESRRIC